ncbi:hypothetical protein PAAG_08374 [Paracoccidioides lutzii Pb01]|uniref:Uncharacterized protein n=1 Tax=Paracoccidioides lutzii (strain ATCC MYA-826 / Pb01) TaxID=502779 RepID=C1HC83_PARBA|nr:hypothetical protein PAAG_08374 [Paracoccidioides lutzii Pb01]EEH38647.2 hypothetical protein PAAG_08374 [Paracoccidioides lutzii Pb01]
MPLIFQMILNGTDSVKKAVVYVVDLMVIELKTVYSVHILLSPITVKLPDESDVSEIWKETYKDLVNDGQGG